MNNLVIEIDGKKYPVTFTYKCIRILSDKLGFNSPVATLQKVGSVFQSLIDAYADLDTNDFDQVDPHSITFEQLDMFSDLVESAIKAADPDTAFAPNDPWKLFVNNPVACGNAMALFFEANIPQESTKTVGKRKPAAKKRQKKKS